MERKIGKHVVSILDGNVKVDGALRGRLEMQLKFGYHPHVVLHLDRDKPEEFRREYEIDHKGGVVESAFKDIAAHLNG